MAIGFSVRAQRGRLRNALAALVLLAGAVTFIVHSSDEAKAAPATQLELTGVNTSITANEADTITVNARDASNALDTGYTGTIAFTSTCGTSCFTITQQPSNANGNPFTYSAANGGTKSFTLRWLPSAVGDQTLTVSQTAGPNAVASDTSPTVSVLSTDATQVELVGVTEPITQGEQDFINVNLRNPNLDVDTNYTGTVTFSASCGDCFTISPNNGGAASKSYTYNGAGDAGQKTFTLVWTQPGTHTFTVTATLAGGGTATDSQSNIDVISTAATAVELVGVTEPIEVGQPDTVTVNLRNANNDVDTNYTGTITFSASCGDCFTISPNNGAAASKSYTFVAGDAGTRSLTLTWTQPGTHTLTVSATLASGGPATDSQSGIDVTPATATDIELTGVSDPQPVNTPETITVRAHSAQNSTVTTYNGTVTFSASCGDCFTISPNNGGAASKSYTYNGAGDGGTKDFTLTWLQTGTFSLTVTDNNNFSDSQSGIDVTGTAPSTTPSTTPPSTTPSTTPPSTTPSTTPPSTRPSTTPPSTSPSTTPPSTTPSTTPGATSSSTTSTTAATGSTSTSTTVASGSSTTATTAASTTTTTVCGAPRIAASPTTVSAGGLVTVTGACFPANSDETVVLNSAPVTLGTVRTDANGAFSARFTIPSTTPAGSHTITVSGTGATASVAIAVTRVAGLGVTGGNTTLVALAMAVIFGGLVLIAGRRLGDQNDEWASGL